MAESSIDSLSIEISANSGKADKALDKLSNSLLKLEKSCNSISSLAKVQGKIDSFSKKIEKLDLSNLKAINSVKINKSIPTNLELLVKSTKGISFTTSNKLKSVAEALSYFSQAKGATLSKTLPTNLKLLIETTDRLSPDTLARLRDTATALSYFRSVKGVSLSKTIPENLRLLGTVVLGLPPNFVERIKDIAMSLSLFKLLKGVTISKTIITRLQELPSVINNFQGMNIESFTTQMAALNNALLPLANTVGKFAASVNMLPASLKTTAASAREVVSTNKALASSTDKVNKTLNTEAGLLGRMYSKALGMWAVFGQVKRIIGSFINESNTYIENMNLFQASMGAGTEAATEFGMKAQDLLGIDFGQWARNQGVFQTLITGMGLASQKADVMSQQLTQLGYDIASFYNIDIEEAMLKLQSGVAGELEPLRRLGWDLSNARMNLELTNLGIEGNAQSMTQAEKVALRYYMIMNQVTIVHGDMARTIASPANQLRVLQAQLTLTARTIGNLLIPAMNMILPTVIAVVKAIRLLAIELANFFGIDATFEVDYSTLDTSGIASAGDDVEDSLDSANSKAKELKNTIMGFDEINKLNDVSSSDSGTNSSNAGIGFDLPLDTYDFFEGLTDDIGKKTDEMAQRIAESMKRILPVVASIGAALTAWRIGTGLINRLGTLKSNMNVLSGDTKKISDNVDSTRARFTLLPSLSGGFMGNIRGSLAGMGGWAAALLVAIAYFGDLWNRSDTFQKGIHATWDYISNIDLGSLLNSIVGFFGGLASGVAEFFGGFFGSFGEVLQSALDAWNISVPEGLVQFFDDINKFGQHFFETFDIGGLDFICSGLYAISMPIRMIGLASEDVVEKVDALGGISEEAASKFGTSLTSMEKATKVLTKIDFGDLVVSESDVSEISGHVEDIKSTILNNLDASKNEELASIDALAGMLPPEQVEMLKSQINELYASKTQTVESGTARINEIYRIAAENNRTITNEEAAEIKSIQEQLQNDLIESSGATKEEINSITRAMNQNNTNAALESASEILQAAIEERDGRVQAAWDSYDAAMSAADGLLAAGKITKEEYENIKQSALDTAQSEQDAANEAYYGENGVVNKVRSGLGDARDQIDTDTGRIKSKWDVFCENTSSSWRNFCDGLGGMIKNAANAVIGCLNTIINGVETMVNDAIRALNRFSVKFPDWLPGVGGRKFGLNIPYASLPRIPYFAQGGFPDQGQLFIARENGAEMVGQMGGNTAVANNQQIVEGIEQGVTRAMLQVLMMNATNEQNSSNDSNVEVVLRIDSEDIARANIKGTDSLMRRGLVPSFGF